MKLSSNEHVILQKEAPVLRSIPRQAGSKQTSRRSDMPCNYVVIISTQPALPRGEATVIFQKYATKQILRTV